MLVPLTLVVWPFVNWLFGHVPFANNREVGKSILFLSSLLGPSFVHATTTADEYLEEAKRFIVQGKNNEAMQSLESAVSLNEKDYLIRFKRAGNHSIVNYTALSDLLRS